MRAALARHDTVLREGIAAHGGVVVTERGDGDSFFALFARPSDALAAACALQRSLIAEAWPEEVAPIRVRMALHTGEAGLHEGADYRGAAQASLTGRLAGARAALSAEGQAAAWAGGQALPVEQAIAEALGQAHGG